MSAGPTPSQTVGPFFAIGLSRLGRADLVTPGVAGERVAIEGRVLDGDGVPVADALLELWQADARGRYAHPDDDQQQAPDPAFFGFGRVPTDEDGRFRVTTVKPGGVPGPDGTRQAPHVVVSVFARGLQRRLVTRIYFPDDEANARDPVLALVPADRRATLVARRDAQAGLLRWDVVLQGPGETVFFDC